MKVLHVCLSSFFIDDRAYQENELVDEHVRQGHEVLVLASTHIHDATGKRAYCEPGEYQTASGAKVIRLPYHRALPQKVMRSLRFHKGVYRMIEAFGPDVILFHGICGAELLTAARYKRNHPSVLFYADSHTDFLNSARSPISKWGLHYLFYKPIVHRALPQIQKILCVSTLIEDFARDFYKIPQEKLEFYPLGGHPPNDARYESRRQKKRSEMGIKDGQILFVQSGKQTRIKHLKEALQAFSQVPDPRFRFRICGVLMDEIREEVEALIAADDRVEFLGWTSPDELEEILCATDVYLQPGSQTSTMQTSICCRCPVVLEDLSSHRLYIDGNGWLLERPEEILQIFEDISAEKIDLETLSQKSLEFARKHLDYATLAKRVLS